MRETLKPRSEPRVSVRLFRNGVHVRADEHGSEQFLPVSGEWDFAVLDKAGKKRECVHDVQSADGANWLQLGASQTVSMARTCTWDWR